MARDTLVRSLYRFQQRIGLTAPEFRAVLVFAGLLVTGSVVDYWRTRAAPVDPAVYEESEAYFRERAAMAGLLGTSVPESTAADSTETPPGTGRVQAASRSGPVGEPPVPRPDQGPVDVNSADSGSLQGLPGIGPALADRIVTFRERNGPFLFVEDLLMVRGIGTKTLERLAPLVTVDGVPAPDSVRGPVSGGTGP